MEQSKVRALIAPRCDANPTHGQSWLVAISLDMVYAQYTWICKACGYASVTFMDRS